MHWPGENYLTNMSQYLSSFYFINRFAANTSDSKVTLYINDFQLNDPGCSQGFDLHRVCNTSFHSAEIPLVFDSEIGYKSVFCCIEKI